MKVLQGLGNALLWIVAILGGLSAILWIANATGTIQPLIVVSGSMEPGISTGDLILSTPIEVTELEPGQVATLPSVLTGKYVTHRVLAIEEHAEGFAITMKGDANEMPDSEQYIVTVGEKVLTPSMTVPRAGFVVASLTKPGVAVPLLITVGALIALRSFPANRNEEGETMVATERAGQ